MLFEMFVEYDERMVVVVFPNEFLGTGFGRMWGREGILCFVLFWRKGTRLGVVVVLVWNGVQLWWVGSWVWFRGWFVLWCILIWILELLSVFGVCGDCFGGLNERIISLLLCFQFCMVMAGKKNVVEVGVRCRELLKSARLFEIVEG
jgi:hypothetical protein